MMVAVKLEGDVLWIRPYGPRLDAAVAPDFKSAVTAGLQERPKAAILHAGTLNFVDSTGLGAIVSVMKQMGSDGFFAIVGATPNVRRLLSMTGLDRVFRLFANQAEAEAALAQRR
jgi:anti-sigma B factor antagonist